MTYQIKSPAPHAAWVDVVDQDGVALLTHVAVKEAERLVELLNITSQLAQHDT